jgi:hypothetical protein
MTPTIMIVGKAGTGKDTLAEFLCGHGGVQVALAKPIKDFAKKHGFSNTALYGPSHERGVLHQCKLPVSYRLNRFFGDLLDTDLNQFCSTVCLTDLTSTYEANGEKLSARDFLLAIGAIGRDLDPDLWIDTGLKSLCVEMASKKAPFGVISDGRYYNEVLKFKRQGGVVVHLTRPSETTSSHHSETDQDGIPRHFYNFEVSNTGSIEDLRCKAAYIVDSVCRGPRIVGSG